MDLATIALLILIILTIVNFAIGIMNAGRLKEINEYAEDGDLSHTLKVYYKRVNDLKHLIHDSSDKTLTNKIESCENRLRNSYSKMYAVHFDAFDGITGKQSFALALLDSSNSGIILTSLYGHNSCNTYLRHITEGNSSVKLIEEEEKALNGAINNLKE